MRILGISEKTKAIVEGGFENKTCSQLSTIGKLRKGKKMHWALFALSKTPRSGSEKTLDQKAPFHPQKNLKDQCKRYQKFV